MSDQEQPEDVGADTERFAEFVRKGEALEREQSKGRAFRIATLLGGLVVLAAVIAVLLR